ncbi:MAG: hypothetical protein ACRC3Y_00970 [Romboutsia sp.]|uniref:hypothetical protein n=1 Tax=Romboutsia sp. TaxID=1965302 RepID=UPI003F40BF9B
MRGNCKSKSKCNSNNNTCECQKVKKINCNCVNTSTNYEKCEAITEQSRELYEQALCYNKKIEKYATMAAQAECRAKQLEEEAKAAWCEYRQFIQQANQASNQAEELMKASCCLLQEAQECYSNLNNSNNSNSCNNYNSCNCGCSCNCSCDCDC